MRRVTKLFNTKATSINDSSKTVTFTISDNKIDRMGEVVDQSSWDFKGYMKNPIVLWGHNPDEPENVLGTAESLEIAHSGSHTDANLRFDTDINPKAALVFNQIKSGTLKTVSVGFINHDEEVKDGVPHLKNNELLEISVVPIPANPRAIALSLKEGTLSRKDATWLMDGMRAEADLLEKQLDEEEETKEVPVDATKQIEVLTEAIATLTKTVADLSTRLDVIPTVIKLLGKAPADRAWDADAAIKRIKEWAKGDDDKIDFGKYRRAFFSGDGDKQGDYKLPFADVIDGELKAVWRGVAAAYEAVQGARGGVEGIDKDAVLAKIKKYYKLFDKPWPEDDGKELPLDDVKTKELATAEETETETDEDAHTEDSEDDSAKGGDNDQPGAETDDEIDLTAELTPELQAQIDGALEDNKLDA